jgi:hypothetical protein
VAASADDGLGRLGGKSRLRRQILRTVVSPLQQRLALPPAAGEIARLAVLLDPADVPANGSPAFSHGGVVSRR